MFNYLKFISGQFIAIKKKNLFNVFITFYYYKKKKKKYACTYVCISIL